jgi:mono/diheme cytochrome c family protein
MTKKTEPGMAYDMNKLNKIFAFLSIAFLITVIWVFLDDYLRPWKAYQIEAMKIQREKLSQSIDDFDRNIDPEKLEKFNSNMEQARLAVAARQDDIDRVEQEIMRVQRDLKAQTLVNGTLSAKVAELAFKYGKAQSTAARSADRAFQRLQRTKQDFANSMDRMIALQNNESELRNELRGYQEEMIVAERELNELLMSRNLMVQAKARTKFDPIFAIRNAPFLDFLDPTLEVRQVVLENITDDRYFVHVPKVDRCITCHTFIDQEGYEDLPNPHRTHPMLNIMVGANSPHPVQTYGCTTCHGGEGHRVNDFASIAHTPQNDEQKVEWISKYNWQEPKYILQPMLPLQYTESSCLKCHADVEFVPGAQKLTAGRNLIEKYGCYGCHQIEGWEHKRKPGPSLERIASKITKDFFKSWVWNPKAFNRHALMPAFFMQENNSTPEFMEMNIAEVNAMAEYIWEKSLDYKPFAQYRQGNADRGKQLIKDVGCMACHGVEGFEAESRAVGAIAGPYLTGTGSKVDPDWLVSWLIKPDHYDPETIMPSFRLTEREAQDIATYLMSLRNESFERLEFEPLNPEVRDRILMTYYTAFDPIDVAEQRLARMSDREKTLELGHRSVGKYGCYSCHNVEGFDDRSPIGPELTGIGTKPLTQFGFNFQNDVNKTRQDWIKAHLINPARWDEGMDPRFQDLTRMPNFSLTNREAELMTLALLGQVTDYIPLSGVRRLTPNEAIANEGWKLMNKYACVACHQVDGEHGNLLALYEDDINEGPPRLADQGFKQQTEWFHYFLDNVHTIRPWLNVRMPSYNLTNEERNILTEAFQAMSNQRTFVDLREPVKWMPGEREAARLLFDTYACASCHTEGFDASIPPSAPSLYLTKRRLRPEWVKEWLKDPQGMMPGTLMPGFWEGGESLDPTILDGDPVRQIDALTKYLLEVGHDNFRPGLKKN